MSQSQSNPISCENCGRIIGNLETPSIWNDRIVCTACKKSLGNSDEPKNTTACPKCNSQDTASLHMIYESGTSNSTFVGFSSGDVNDVMIGGGQSQSIISSRAAPPIKKSATAFGIMAVFLCLVALIIVIYNFNYYGYPRIVGTDICFGVIGVICGIYANRQSKWNTEHYPRLYSQWAKSWMCRRCGYQFIPKQDKQINY